MKTFARIEGGVVAELLSALVLPPFHPSLVWVEAIDGVALGWIYASGVFAAPVISGDRLVAIERAWRDSELSSMVWLRDRHRDQLELGVATALTSAQFAELLAYMQALRDWPQAGDFPAIEQRPMPPAFIVELGGDQ